MPIGETSAALVVAHPAHELRVYGWLSRVRPCVHILTTGSRSGADSERLAASARFIGEAGGVLANSERAMLDRDVYGAIMAGDARSFHAWTTQLVADLAARAVKLVVVDSWQNYNVAHDLTHLMGRVAAAETSDALGWPVEVLDYAVVHEGLAPGAPPSELKEEISLSAEEFARKLAIARNFPDIQTELDELVAGEGEEGFSVERLNRPPSLSAMLERPVQKPAYERYGEARVASGLYTHVLRWDHAAAIVRSFAERRPDLFNSSHPGKDFSSQISALLSR